MKKTLLAIVIVCGVNAQAGLRVLTADSITCTAIKPIFESELELSIEIKFQDKVQTRTAELNVFRFGRTIAKDNIIYSKRLANLRNDLFAGRIEKDNEGNDIHDGIMITIDSQDLTAIHRPQVFLAFNRPSLSRDMYVLVGRKSQLTLPKFGVFSITSCH